MIEIKGLTKCFGSVKALDNVSFNISDGSVFGLVGSNGAGKSTLLRLLSGVYKADGGNAYIDGEVPYENLRVKDSLAFVSDFPYFYPGTTVDSMAYYYKQAYSQWDDIRYSNLKSVFPISPNQKISSMSKGMQRQAAIILALSHAPKYIFFDEIFDGLDPVIRELVKKILIEYISVMNATVVIASHNLRELEGFCDHIGLLHRGGVLLEKDIDGESAGIYRVQFVMEQADFEEIKPLLKIVNETHQGKMIQLTVKGDEEEIRRIIHAKAPVFFESLPLTLEELFISEMEEAGYEINKLFS
ncbi:MAG TPA: ABC transporter ATP-binding protein [Candidatus Eubacterium faecavium]|nr:ABC transporter ATP-binding protein [Candidatus Eubacterium faecavium]